MNKQAQIGETMTWMVGTIVIIVILAIAIFVVQVSKSKDKVFSPHISNDLIVTKSVVSFFKHDSNFENLQKSINSGSYDLFKGNLEPFLKSISPGDAIDFRVFMDNIVISESVIVNNYHNSFPNFAYFYFNLESKKINLKFDIERKNA